MNVAHQHRAFLLERFELRGKIRENALRLRPDPSPRSGPRRSPSRPGARNPASPWRRVPIAATMMSARRAIPARSLLFEWQIVTVAFAWSSNSAMRLAHDVAAPDHHRVRAFDLDIAAAQNFHHARGRAGHQRRPVRRPDAPRSSDEIRPHLSPESPHREFSSSQSASAAASAPESRPRRRGDSARSRSPAIPRS